MRQHPPRPPGSFHRAIRKAPDDPHRRGPRKGVSTHSGNGENLTTLAGNLIDLLGAEPFSRWGQEGWKAPCPACPGSEPPYPLKPGRKANVVFRVAGNGTVRMRAGCGHSVAEVVYAALGLGEVLTADEPDFWWRLKGGAA